MVLALLAACSNDFGLNASAPEPAEPTDTAAVDTAGADTDTEETDAPEDTAVREDTDLPEDTDVPDDDTTVVDDPAPEDDCEHTSDLVYVVERDAGRLYSYDPAANTFTLLGAPSCGTSQTPASMAVNRDGTAYVRYSDNKVYAVDLTTMACSVTAYSDRTTRFDSFGMGYATDSADTWRDQLYVANEGTLAVIDPSTWTLRTLGTLPSQSELTGNADGELWAVLPLERVAELRRMDKDTGATLETVRVPAFPDPSELDTFAFATWNGDFYIFLRMHGMGETTNVYKVTRDGTMTMVLEDAGFDVVGAGVSTCAPA